MCFFQVLSRLLYLPFGSLVVGDDVSGEEQFHRGNIIRWRGPAMEEVEAIVVETTKVRPGKNVQNIPRSIPTLMVWLRP
jgi:hypothetical protein